MTRLRRMAIFLAKALVCLLPWPLRKHVLATWLGYRFAPGARIAFLNWIYPEALDMGPSARIGPLNVAIHLHSLQLGEAATIGRGNWITGHPRTGTRHFVHRPERDPSLYLGDHSAITKSHIIDCTDAIHVGAFTTIAGYRSQFLTHAIDAQVGRQDCRPIRIGDYCFVGTGCVVLGGAVLPDASVLGALSLLNKAHAQPNQLYAGSPARAVKALDPQGAYFTRNRGFVE